MNEKSHHNDQVIITELRGLRDLQNEKFARIESILDEQKEQHQEFKRQIEKQSNRITLIELWQSNTVGKLSIISIALGFGISAIWGWVTKQFS